jgi:C-terminal processing protease CtpA/Prc
LQRGAELEPTKLMLDLDGHPTRLGISWREDSAEPGMVLLTRVVPGSPAALAKLTPGDRVYQVAGRDFADGNGFFELVTTLDSPLELTVEREGCFRTVTLKVPPPVAARSL